MEENLTYFELEVEDEEKIKQEIWENYWISHAMSKIKLDVTA